VARDDAIAGQRANVHAVNIPHEEIESKTSISVPGLLEIETPFLYVAMSESHNSSHNGKEFLYRFGSLIVFDEGSSFEPCATIVGLAHCESMKKCRTLGYTPCCEPL
jgi:hypothetical protein